MRKSYLLLFVCFCFTQLYALVPSTSKIRLTDNWEFLKQDVGGIWEIVRSAPTGGPESAPIWTKVTLPHCFNASDAVDPDLNYYQGPGWYKTLLSLKNNYTSGRIFLDFEGAGQKTDVYIYTTKVGSHIGGYDEWTVDITDAVEQFIQTDVCKRQFKGKVPLSIRCDNSRDLEMIPSNLSDFNVYGGLYRYVNLVYVPQVSFDWIKINSILGKEMKSGTIEVNSRLYNPLGEKGTQIALTIKDPSGKEIYNIKPQKVDSTDDIYSFKQEVKRPMLWDVNNPQLYICEMTLTTNNQQLHAIQKFGFRKYKFVDKGPFLLNGKRLLLKGTHRHEDHAGVAAAMTESQIKQEMKMIKEMGVNFIRLGHYQQSDIVLQQCDELGILVWEEVPWCRGGLGGESYKAQARRMLTNMIEQHHNHPSIIIWGLGNENDWPNDFETFEKYKIRAFMTELNNLAHQMDSTRMTAIRRCDFCKDIVDVYSPSIWAGWYKGIFTDYSKFAYDEMNQVKHFLHAEWGGDSHAQRHAESALMNSDKIQRGKDLSFYNDYAKALKNGDWSETYIVQLIDWHLKEQENMPWLTGSACWTFKDFSTPIRPNNPIPYVNQKGVVERDFTKKEAYYVFQSYWTKKPMLHIYGHSWPVRWGDKDEMKQVLVYSNCKKVELIVNGISQGIKVRNSQDFPAAGLRWNVPFKEGNNKIKAIAIKDKKVAMISDEIQFEYQTKKWGKEAEIKLKSTPISADSLMVEAQLVDINGIRCLDSKKQIEFGITGDAQLIQNMGTSTGSRKIEAYNGRACIKVIRKGQCFFSAKSDNIPTAFIKL